MARDIGVPVKIQHQVHHLYGVVDPQFEREMGTLLGPAILPGNQITALQNGDAIFPAMLKAIRAVMLDWLGSEKITTRLLSRMTAAGVEVERYHPLRWYSLGKLNNRTHRKVLIVDGKFGFTGGVGIADQWTGQAQDPDHWRDMHFLIEGPLVAQFQAAFLDNWIKTTGRFLNGGTYFPKLAPAGELKMHS